MIQNTVEKVGYGIKHTLERIGFQDISTYNLRDFTVCIVKDTFNIMIALEEEWYVTILVTHKSTKEKRFLLPSVGTYAVLLFGYEKVAKDLREWVERGI